MDAAYWEGRARDADASYSEPFARFVDGLASSLGCASALEVGCNAGNDLRLLAARGAAMGLEASPAIAEIARARLPGADIRVGRAEAMPHADGAADMVFTHGFLGCLGGAPAGRAAAEMLRVARRYVMTCEPGPGSAGAFPGSEGLDARRLWDGLPVRVVSDVEMHPDIDPSRPRFVLVAKA